MYGSGGGGGRQQRYLGRGQGVAVRPGQRLIGVGSRKGRSGRYSNMGKGSSVEYGIPARPWAVGAGSRRAMFSVLTVLAQLLCRCVCVCSVLAHPAALCPTMVI